MCRTIHALLTVVICGVQMLVRVFMTLILMIENVIRMFLQTLYNFISFLLQLISLIPICCVFFATSRLKCFMCGGGGPCPVRRGGGCDCLMSAVAIIILFFIFRATGVLDKIFYSIGYAKAAKHVVKYSPTPGTITECSRNDSFVTNATTPQMLPSSDEEISSPAIDADTETSSESMDFGTTFGDDGTNVGDDSTTLGDDETKDEDAETMTATEVISSAVTNNEEILSSDLTTKYQVADLTNATEHKEKEIIAVSQETDNQTKTETTRSSAKTTKPTLEITSEAAITTKYNVPHTTTTTTESETQVVTPVPTTIETIITVEATTITVEETTINVESVTNRRLGEENLIGGDDDQIDEESRTNTTKTNEDTIILYYDDDTQIIGNNLTANKNNDDSREIDEEEDMHLSEIKKHKISKSKISVKATRSSYHDTYLDKLKLKGLLGTTSISYYMV